MLCSACGWLLGISLGFLLVLADDGKSNPRDLHSQKLVYFFRVCNLSFFISC